MYDYETQKKELFTDEGQKAFIKVRDNVKELVKKTGAIRMLEAMSIPMRGSSFDTWTRMACVDRMVELNDLVEIETNHWGQDRVFVKGFY